MDELKKPPIGIKPNWIRKQERLNELYFAVNRFLHQGYRPKIDWLEEILSLEKELEERNRKK